jgi:hypothetical protein
MNTREVERELTAVLHRHAEDAMNRTNTRAEHQKLQSVLADQARTGRRRWVVGGLAAAVVAAAVGVVLWSSDSGGHRSSPPPTNAPDSIETTSLAAAEGVAAAFVNHGTAGAAPYLAPGMKAPWAGWPASIRRDLAWGVKYLMEPCAPTTTDSLTTVFSCPFAMHLLGSREVGKGPFPDNVLNVDVSGGKVTSADSVIPFETNGVLRYLHSIYGWIGENHPKNEHFLLQDEVDVKRADWPRYSELWKQYVREYVAATNEAR